MSDTGWFPEAWRPQAGESITGGIVDVRLGEAGWGAYPVVVLRVAETERERDVAVHAFHDVLQNELARRGVQVGDVITITYLGKHEKGYHGYRISGAERPFDWSQFGGAGAPAPPAAPRPTPMPSSPPPGFGIPENETAGEPVAAPGQDPDDIPF